MKDRGQFSTSQNSKLNSSASLQINADKIGRNTYSNFKPKNATTEMNKSAPKKFNQSVN